LREEARLESRGEAERRSGEQEQAAAREKIERNKEQRAIRGEYQLQG